LLRAKAGEIGDVAFPVRSHPFTSRANSLAPFTAGQAALFYPDVHPVVVLKESSRRKIIVRYRHIYISRFYVVQYPPAARCGSSCGSTRAPADPRVRQRMHIGWLRFLGGNRRRHPRRTNGKIKETVSRLCTASVYRADCLVSIICRRRGCDSPERLSLLCTILFLPSPFTFTLLRRIAVIFPDTPPGKVHATPARYTRRKQSRVSGQRATLQLLPFHGPLLIERLSLLNL